MELHKNLTLDPSSNPSSAAAATTMTLTSTPMAIPLTQLVKPSPLALAASLPAAAGTTLFATTHDLNNFSSHAISGGGGGPSVRGAGGKPLTTKIRATAGSSAATGLVENGNKSNKTDRKFAPYW